MLMGMMIVVGFIVGFLVGCTGMGGKKRQNRTYLNRWQRF